ncbi:hypothetical protein [Arthrobacter phage SWEP2]|jgi:hypothetical protein|uniref:Uncharacterized protein n=1 Tax=Arthrobacter phage SWEP2 TaxID=2945958 RepID=A0A9E7SGS5_9CAUD|nr:hypothetical protein [Arthrobacter phage SWEP2]
MARKFTKKDVRPWRVCTRQGKTLTNKRGERLDQFSGYADAQAVADKIPGAVAVRA